MNNNTKLAKLISVAQGQSEGDFILAGGSILNVFTKEFIKQDLIVSDSSIAAIGDASWWKAKQTIDCSNKYIVPGFIDAHMHIESTMVTPIEFSKIVAELGTTSVIADCHEIANVLGDEGMMFMLSQAEQSIISIYNMVPSCVPATAFENAGGTITSNQVSLLLNKKGVIGLGEMMNYPGVLSLDDEVLSKIESVHKKNISLSSFIIDGHCPSLLGKSLQAYCSAGIKTDHESSSFEEALEKIKSGLCIMLRYGSGAKDLLKIVPGIIKSKIATNRFLFCTDDKKIGDIKLDGHINANIRESIKLGMSPEEAYTIASWNAACCYNLSQVGAIAPGYISDLVVIDNLESVKINSVYKNGILVSKNSKNKSTEFFNDDELIKKATESVKLSSVDSSMFKFTWEKSNETNVSEFENAIQLVPSLLITKKSKIPTKNILSFINDGKVCRLAVFERHHFTGNHSLCLLEGYNLKRGAIASSIGHDSHNIICAGISPDDMQKCVSHIQQMQGGICIVLDGKVISELPLPIAGLMSDKSSDFVIQKTNELHEKALLLGIPKTIEPFVTLSFLALPVIPSLRLTDEGLFDVDNWKFI